ncbi:YegS/Rv2252/BmrU family lipid kinase [Hymenobacter busanensis]|uniref:YegS/Rv2252/BmrU family lipid kinase n=1 Tax=Hymenobacter busanensis TaxID=2607656 RepID=A0A7L4ZT75_9BACT|nr:YegS/Rv2252/BmrU family lipid kinase [Hymenobacter busanensis]KAA9327529.1 YegS/Rv2252/BmrU family lipid kinase [Hymenobacter busanensis]QHJ06133.1 YegS/Rv2252/BmrU family lipid kinase [Hymenobacter busanensis]
MTPNLSRLCFIFNPISGTNRNFDLQGLLNQVLSKDYALHYEIRPTQYAGHAEELAREAAAQGYGIVVAVGGDGTVNEVGRGLLGTGAAMAVLPRGSGNGLARHLGIPLRPEAAVALLRRPRVLPIDVGRLNGRPFFCTAGLGFDAHVSRCFAEAGTRGLSTYVRVALREYQRYRPCPVEITLGDKHIQTDCYVLAFANAAQYGNNAYIAPLADIRDGLLDVCLINQLPFTRAIRVAYGLAAGNLPTSGAADYHTAQTVHVRAEQALGFHLDGDYAGDATDFTVALEPLALPVVVGEGFEVK